MRRSDCRRPSDARDPLYGALGALEAPDKLGVPEPRKPLAVLFVGGYSCLTCLGQRTRLPPGRGH